jgi:hypothetical protein
VNSNKRRAERANGGSIPEQRRRSSPFSSDRASQQLRTLITRQAAKLIAEGLTDYHAAKLKAARQLNCNDKNALPDNHEIEAALREHLSLFAADTQPAALAALRRVALRAMRWLQIEGQGSASKSAANAIVFEPWLAGAVLNGTANEFSDVELELVGVETKTMEFILLNRGVEFDLTDGNAILKSYKPANTTKNIQYHLEFEGAPVVITLYDSHVQRHALFPHGSIKHERAKLTEAEALFGIKR